MKPFLTVHQKDPRVFFVEPFPSERCAVTSLPDKMRLFMLHEPNRSFTFLHVHTKEGNSERSLVKEGLGGKGGYVTAWMLACLVVTCVQY